MEREKEKRTRSLLLLFNFIIIIIAFSPYSMVYDTNESLQLILSYASFWSLFQLYPPLFTSSTTHLLHAVLGFFFFKQGKSEKYNLDILVNIDSTNNGSKNREGLPGKTSPKSYSFWAETVVKKIHWKHVYNSLLTCQ